MHTHSMELHNAAYRMWWLLTTDVAVLADVAFCFADVAIDSPTWQMARHRGTFGPQSCSDWERSFDRPPVTLDNCALTAPAGSCDGARALHPAPAQL